MNKLKIEETKNAAQELGKKGGLAVRKKYGRDYYSRIGKLAAKARWGKKINKRKE